MRLSIRRIINKENLPLILLIVAAFAIRIAGIDFALPLWLVGDEPAIVYAPLKMIELKTLIPALHFEEFVGKFYYMPFISYIYLLPFLFVLGVKFILFSGTMAEFKNFLMLDLSAFFITARFVSVLIGTATVYFVYKISNNIFKNNRTALFSAAFLCFALLHIVFSHWARHWALSTFIFTLIIYFLSHPNLSKNKRYIISSLICGIGAGMVLEITIVPIFMIFWFFFYDKLSLFKEIRTKWFWACIFIFFGIFISASLIWPEGPYLFKVKNDTTLTFQSVVNSLKNGYTFYFFDVLKKETVLLVLFFIGIITGFNKFRNYFIPIILSVLFYTFIFYNGFNNISRFWLLLYPFLAIIAGYGLNELLNLLNLRKSLFFIAVVLVFAPLALNAAAFDYLLIKNDTRVQAIDWINKNIPEKSKVLVLVPLMRLPSTSEMINEQESINSDSLRSIEQSERLSDDKFFIVPRFNSLNLNAVTSSLFYSDLQDYIIAEKFEYIIFDDTFAKVKGVDYDLAEIGETVKSFQGENVLGGSAPTDGDNINMKRLITLSNFGPSIVINRVNISVD